MFNRIMFNCELLSLYIIKLLETVLFEKWFLRSVVRFFLLDVNQVPDKRRHENTVYKPTGQSTISSKPAVRTEANLVQPIQLAVVAQNYNKWVDRQQTNKQTNELIYILYTGHHKIYSYIYKLVNKHKVTLLFTT